VSTEEKIKEAAKSVFVRNGYSGARMQDIADEAGINKALLHYYFRSKEKLFELIFFEVFDVVIPQLKATVSTDQLVAEKIKAFVSTYIDVIQANPHVPIFILHELSQGADRFVEKLKQRQVLPEMAQFMLQLMSEMEAGKVKSFQPLHLFMNIISMCAFPFVAKPLLQAVSGLSEEDWTVLMDERKEEVTRFILSAIKK